MLSYTSDKHDTCQAVGFQDLGVDKARIQGVSGWPRCPCPPDGQCPVTLDRAGSRAVLVWIRLIISSGNNAGIALRRATPRISLPA